ncbi:mgtA regulatory leader peptide MgtL [Salmonella enterica subsp. enterica]|nr:mgtA regulatory leader peptide MgtL [Salmonella enterica subsp. enterica serovar Bovismorbificans]
MHPVFPWRDADGDKKSNFTQAKGNGQSLVYRWFNYVTVRYRHNCHKTYGFMRIILGANYLLTGGDMDPEPTPLPRWRIFLFR